MGYVVVEHKDLFKTCHAEKNPFGLEVLIVIIHDSYLRYLITIFTFQASQIQHYKSSSVNIYIILYLHYLLFPFKIFSLSEVKPFVWTKL